jgi:hypothetical protein
MHFETMRDRLYGLAFHSLPQSGLQTTLDVDPDAILSGILRHCFLKSQLRLSEHGLYESLHVVGEWALAF